MNTVQLHSEIINELKDALANKINMDDILSNHYIISALLNIIRYSNDPCCDNYFEGLSKKLEASEKNVFYYGVNNFFNYNNPITKRETHFLDVLPVYYKRYICHSVASDQGFYLTPIPSYIMELITRDIHYSDNSSKRFNAYKYYFLIKSLCDKIEYGTVIYFLHSEEDNKLYTEMNDMYLNDAITLNKVYDVIDKYGVNP